MIYDIIGDVHGNSALLVRMLQHLGYKMSGKLFYHEERKAVFVGDFINRGNNTRKTLQIIQGMVESGHGFAILGNHEIYALIYHLKDENGVSIGKNSNDLSVVMKNTLKEFSKDPLEWKSYRKWIRTLPLFLDFGDFRVIHACWSDDIVSYLRENLNDSKIRKQVLREIYKKPESEIGRIIWQATRGLYFHFPGDIRIRDNKGVYHRSFRMKWWESPVGKTFGQISFEDKFRLPDYTVPPEILPDIKPYPDDAPIVFFGHYRRLNGPYLIRHNLCCLDSGSGVSKILTAYSFNGEKVLDQHNLIQIE